jgi:GMP synthase-like glutamine amidotransferase
MKPVLILQHQTPERPAYLVTWLDRYHIPHETCNAGTGQEFPASIEPYSALAVMGGGMSANDPLLSNRQAEILILQAMYRDRPVIGHCLGGQLMARALGGTISITPQPEIGWQPIEYEDVPETQAWFGSLPTSTVIQWHYDTFSIPTGATRLAGSAACANQAFAIGPHLAMQFHIEMDADKATEWAWDEDPKWESARAQYASVQDRDGILNGIDPYLGQHQIMADHIYRTWLSTTDWAGVVPIYPF